MNGRNRSVFSFLNVQIIPRDESQKVSVQINTVLFENLIIIDALLIILYHFIHEYLNTPFLMSSLPSRQHFC